jgi:hypothetical protein
MVVVVVVVVVACCHVMRLARRGDFTVKAVAEQALEKARGREAYSCCLLFRSHTKLLPRGFQGTSEQVLRKQKTVGMSV